MRPNTRSFLPGAALAAALSALAAIPGSAQQAPAPRREAYPAAVVLSQMGQSAGVTILADSTVQGRLPLPAVPATSATVEQQIGQMMRALPAGTTWAKLYVPAPTGGRWNGDVVANYAHALAQVVGTVGRAAPAGSVEILGRQVPADKASEYITALNLKLVYLVTNPQAPAMTMTNPAANWSQMRPDQRDAYARSQAQRLMALDPTSRVQALVQMMQIQEESPQQAVMRAMMSQLSDDERVQLKMTLGAAKGAYGGGK